MLDLPNYIYSVQSPAMVLRALRKNGLHVTSDGRVVDRFDRPPTTAAPPVATATKREDR